MSGITESELQKMSDASIQMFAQGSTFTGLYPSALPFLYYHAFGNRIFVTVNLEEPSAKAHVETFQEVVKGMAALDESAVREYGTLRSGYLSPGDILYVPACHICFERAVNANNVGFRVYCPLFWEKSFEQLQVADKIFPEKLELNKY